jgi:hypothetical protein
LHVGLPATEFGRRGATVVITARDGRRGLETARTITERTGNRRSAAPQAEIACGR